MSTDSSDADLDAFAAANSLGACIGAGNLTTSYANGKTAFYDSGRAVLWRGSGDVIEITTDLIKQEAGGGEPNLELLRIALISLVSTDSLQKYGDW